MEYKHEEKSFSDFIKRNQKRIDKIKEKYNGEVTKAGIEDLLLLLWLMEENEESVFNKLESLLDRLLRSRFINLLSRFKLAGDRKK